MKCTARGLLFGLLVATVGTATAQPWPYGGWGPEMGPPQGVTGFQGPMRLDVDSQSEREFYFIAIRFAGVAPDEVKIAQEGRELRVTVERAGGGPGPMGRGFMSGRMSRSVFLPADADFSRAQRQEMPGLITFVVPRRFGPWR